MLDRGANLAVGHDVDTRDWIVPAATAVGALAALAWLSWTRPVVGVLAAVICVPLYADLRRARPPEAEPLDPQAEPPALRLAPSEEDLVALS